MSVNLESSTEKNNAKRKRIASIVIPIVILALILALRFLFHAFRYEWTDDAAIAADVTDVSSKVSGQILQVHVRANQEVHQGDFLAEIDPRDYQARLKEAQAALQSARSAEEAAQIDVKLTSVTSRAGVVQESSGVRFAKSGVKIAKLHVAAADSQLGEARAGLWGAQADARLADADCKRYQQLYSRDEVSKQQLDRALADERRTEANLEAARDRVKTALFNLHQAQSRVIEARSQVGQATGRFQKANVVEERIRASRARLQDATARVKQGEASLRTAELNLSYTRIRAPVAGRVTDKTVEPGNYVQSGQVLLSLVTRQVWVIANFKETQLTRMRPGQQANIKVDAYPGKVFKGHLDSIQAGTGSAFSLLPPENATGNYVKVVQRVPVKIVFDEPIDPRYELTPGMSAVPEIEVSRFQ